MSYPYPSNYAFSPALTAPVVERVPEDVEGEAKQYLPEVKRQLSMADDVQDYDDALLRLIKTAIADVETYTGVAIQPQMVTVSYAGYSGAPLPFGPVWQDPLPEVTPANDGATITFTDLTASQVSEGQFPYLVGRFEGGKVVYKSGYTYMENATPAVPENLVGAVVQHAAASWRAAGVSGGKPDGYWKTLAARSRRF